MACEIHLNDIGTLFRLLIVDCSDAPVDLSLAISLTVNFKTGSTLKTKTGVAYTNGTDHAVDYVTIAGDLDALGKWKVQAVVELPTGTWSSVIQEFKVESNLA